MFSAAVLSNSRIARIVFRDTRFHLAHQIGADVSRLGVDAPAELRKECDEARAEAVADDEEWNLRCPLLRRHTRGRQQRDDREQAADTEQRHRHREQSRHSTAAQRGLQCGVQRLHGSAGDADIGADRDPHAHVAGNARAQGAEKERQRDEECEHLGIRDRITGRGFTQQAVANEQERGDHDCQHRDRLVLPGEVGFRPFLNRVRDGPHGVGSGASRKHPAREEPGKHEGDHATPDDDAEQRRLRSVHDGF
jgi:hypothetical protein